MEWHEIAVNGQRTVKFPEKVLPGVVNPIQATDPDHDAHTSYAHKIGGIIKRGEWAWLAYGCSLKVHSLRKGQTVSTYDFAATKGYDNCYIKWVEEVFPGNVEGIFLAVCLQCYHAPSGSGSFVALYSVDLSDVLSCVKLSFHVTCACFMPTAVCRRSLLQNFNGCLALGSEEGVVLLLDLNISKILPLQAQKSLADLFTPCHIVDYNLSLTDIHRHFRKCQEDGTCFGLQLEVIDTPCAVQCLLPIDVILGLAIGMEDGRLVFYDLAELQIFYTAIPQQHQKMAPLIKMDFLEPTDDPRPCLYVWTMHDNDHNLTAVLHTLMYEKRFMEDDGSCTFENFQSSAVRLELPLEATRSVGIACQAVTKLNKHAEEDATCLCALSWYSVLEEKNKLLIFDLNQWYKEQMPFVLRREQQASYLVGYVLSGQQCGLDAFLRSTTIAHFYSIHRYEEHFHPISLSFDFLLLLTDGCRAYNWEGAQNRVINMLRVSNASIFLEPDLFFNEIIRTRLMPQFCELHPNSTFSKNAKYELILSVALENNCYSLLRDCARCWADGSFLGNFNNFSSSTSLSLSTLTEWIWKRATDIKRRCNDLSKGLFNYDGYPLDDREKKEFGFITRQLKLLADLLLEVLNAGKRNIPENVFYTLESKQKSLHMATDYQQLLLWLLNIGLLPEAPSYSGGKTAHKTLVLYPYKQLHDLYTNKRRFFGKMSENFLSKKTGSCRLLYIDTFIEHTCKSSVLREYWLENNGDGLYPPTSIEAMLRVMLVPDLNFDSKCAILLYFFLDLNVAIEDSSYEHVVSNFIKFPSIFKLPAPLIKTVQSFWNLDHGHFLPAVDELVSPFNNNQNFPQWLLELLIESLLSQNASNLALRVLEAWPTLISPVLKLKTLLTNELISEAFHFARSQNDDMLLEIFFNCCLCTGKFGVIRDLALNEKEGQLVQRLLKQNKSNGAESLHFVYLLQKSKYLEAVSYMDELSKSKCVRSSYENMDTPHLVLSAFNHTMAPVTQGLTDVYFRIKNKIKKKEVNNTSPVPLSCQLIKQNANNLLGGIYHSSALSAHFATYYWGELESRKRDEQSLLSANNAPFLRKPQPETYHLDYLSKSSISYPQSYKVNEKRTLTERQSHSSKERVSDLEQNPKKRRRLLAEEIVSDLTQIMQKQQDTSKAHLTCSSDLSFQTAFSKQQSNQELNESFLTQPLVKVSSTTQNELTKSAAKSFVNTEIHGILKTHTPEPKERRELHVEEEKNLRFKLPSVEHQSPKTTEEANSFIPKLKHSTSSVDQSIDENTAQGIDKEESMEVDVQLNTVPVTESVESTEKHKVITRSLSVESSTCSTSSKEAETEDRFYSPLPSQNVSLNVTESRGDALTEISSTPKEATERVKLLSGPKPRKPIDRFSNENSEKSLSPEPIDMQKGSRSEFDDKYIESKKNVLCVGRAPLSSTVTFSSTSSTLQIPSVSTFTSGEMHEFTPTICSSKIEATQSKFTDNIDQTKFTELATVVGGLTHVEFNERERNENQSFQESENVTLKSNTKIQIELLDTTVDMDSYDSSITDLVIAESHTTLNTSTRSIEKTEGKSFDNMNMLKASVKGSPRKLKSEEKEIENKLRDEEFLEENVLQKEETSQKEAKTPILKESAEKCLEPIVSTEISEATTRPAYKGEKLDEADVVIVLSSSSSLSSSTSSSSSDTFGKSNDDDDDEDEDNDDDDSEMSGNSDDPLEVLSDTEDLVGEQVEEEDEVEYDENQDFNAIEENDEDDESNEDRDDETTPRIEEEIKIIETIDENELNQNVELQKDDKDGNGKHDQPIEKDKVEVELIEDDSCQVEPVDVEIKEINVDEAEDFTIRKGVSKEIKTDESYKEQGFDKQMNVESDVEISEDEMPPLVGDENLLETPVYSASFVMETSPTVIRDETAAAQAEATIEKAFEIEETVPELILETQRGAVTESNKDLAQLIQEGVKKTIEAPEEKQSESVEMVKSPVDMENEKEDQTAVITAQEKGASQIVETADKKMEPTKIEETENTEDSQEVSIIRKRARSISKTVTAYTISTSPTSRKVTRGSSVPPAESVLVAEIRISTPRSRNTRGISMPPQALVDEEPTRAPTPLSHREKRASSVQNPPPASIEFKATHSVSGSAGTPRTRRQSRDESVPPAEEDSKQRNERGTSMPPARVLARSRGAGMDKLNENVAVLDSPSTRTRLRLRLSSVDSELDTPPVANSPQPGRTRRTSVTSNASEQPEMPRRTRRHSTTSQADSTGTPRTLRSRSTLTVQEETQHEESTKSTPKRKSAKRKQSMDEKLDISASSSAAAEGADESDQTNEELSPESRKKQKESPKSDIAVSSTSYSSSRRLTRTQLAIMEKSAALAAGTTRSAPLLATSGSSTSPSTLKRVSKRRSSRSTNTTNPDSDGAESISSYVSSHVSNAVKRHYATRNSVKDKDEVDDDLISIASSVGSERASKRRSKEKNSPNTTLTVIPEEETEVKVERKKRGRASKKQ